MSAMETKRVHFTHSRWYPSRAFPWANDFGARFETDRCSKLQYRKTYWMVEQNVL